MQHCSFTVYRSTECCRPIQARQKIYYKRSSHKDPLRRYTSLKINLLASNENKLVDMNSESMLIVTKSLNGQNRVIYRDHLCVLTNLYEA